jgi:hypothetical protein
MSNDKHGDTYEGVEGRFTQLFCWGVKHGQGMKPTTHLHLVLRLRMCGAIPLLTPYAFMV